MIENRNEEIILGERRLICDDLAFRAGVYGICEINEIKPSGRAFRGTLPRFEINDRFYIAEFPDFENMLSNFGGLEVKND